MINEKLKERIEWFDTDHTIAKDIIQNYELWVDENYGNRITQSNKDILIDGVVIDLSLQTAKISQEIFDDLKIKNKQNIKIVIKAIASTHQNGGSKISEKYATEYNEIQDNIINGNALLNEILNDIDDLPDNDWDIYKEWKSNECMYTRDKDGNITGVNCCYANIIGWLDHFPLTKDKIEYDSIKMEVSWNKKTIKDSDTHDIMQMFNKYLSRDFSNLRAMHDALYGYAIKRKVNNVVTYLNNLEEWDGVDYIDKAIREVLCCEEIDKYYKLYYDELKMHGVAFLRRTYNKELYGIPTKYDQILTFASKAQGSGKTTFHERLYNFGDKTGYCYVVAGCDFKPQEKDFVIQAHKNCCMCLDEIDMKRGLVNSIKGFISRQSDEFRLPYGIDSMKPVRGFVITATSNNTDFLKDYTTKFERRWHIIHVSENKANNRNINKAFDEGFGDKLWSQFIYLYKNEPQYETWIEEGTEIGKLLAELQQGYKFYDTDDDYMMLDSVLEKEYAKYDDSEAMLTADDIVEQFQFVGDITEWIEKKNAAIKKKTSLDNYIPNPSNDRLFSTTTEKLNWIPVQTLNTILRKLCIDCTPQGIKNHLTGTWECKNKKWKGMQYWSYVRIDANNNEEDTTAVTYF